MGNLSSQFALLLGSLAGEPLAPRELVLPSVVGRFDGEAHMDDASEEDEEIEEEHEAAEEYYE